MVASRRWARRRPGWRPSVGIRPFPFLGSFLPEARRFWSAPRPDRLTWGPCAELDPEGREFHFTVSALSLPDRQFLVFEIDRNAEAMRALLQKAREQALGRGRSDELPDDGTRDTGPISEP